MPGQTDRYPAVCGYDCTGSVVLAMDAAWGAEGGGVALSMPLGMAVCIEPG